MMEAIIDLLKGMGAINITHDECPCGSYSSTLAFEFNGKKASIGAQPYNTQEAGFCGEVEIIDNLTDRKEETNHD